MKLNTYGRKRGEKRGRKEGKKDGYTADRQKKELNEEN